MCNILYILAALDHNLEEREKKRAICQKLNDTATVPATPASWYLSCCQPISVQHMQFSGSYTWDLTWWMLEASQRVSLISSSENQSMHSQSCSHLCGAWENQNYFRSLSQTQKLQTKHCLDWAPSARLASHHQVTTADSLWLLEEERGPRSV